jgi:hypothetical protein
VPVLLLDEAPPSPLLDPVDDDPSGERLSHSWLQAFSAMADEQAITTIKRVRFNIAA